MKTWLLRAAVLFAILVSAGFLLRQSPPTSQQGASTSIGSPRIVTTILPIYSLARIVAADDGVVHNLLRPGADVHDVSFGPEDIATCTQADIVFLNGAGLDDFILEALRRARVPSSRLVVVSDGLPRIGQPDTDHDDTHHGHSHSTWAGDPHYWLNPAYAQTYVRRIADAIAKRSAHPEAVRARAVDLGRRIAALDREFESGLAPLRGRALITHHAAYTHLALRYGLRIVGVWQSTPGREPTPQEVANLLRIARTNDVAALMVEPQFTSRSIDLLSRDAGLRLVRIDPMETAADPDTLDYVGVMRRNLRALREALR